MRTTTQRRHTGSLVLACSGRNGPAFALVLVARGNYAPILALLAVRLGPFKVHRRAPGILWAPHRKGPTRAD
jgi:hypothetical protein